MKRFLIYVFCFVGIFTSFAQSKDKPNTPISTSKEDKVKLAGIWQRIAFIRGKINRPNEESIPVVQPSIKVIKEDGTFQNLTIPFFPKSAMLAVIVQGKWSASLKDSVYLETIQDHLADKSIEGSTVKIKISLSPDGHKMTLTISYPNGTEEEEEWLRLRFKELLQKDALQATSPKGLLNI